MPGVYAVGDVTAKLMLAHVAEAWASSRRTSGAQPWRDRLRDDAARDVLPTPSRQFGLTEAQARGDAAARVATSRGQIPFRANGKAHGYGDPTGFAKVIADRAHGSWARTVGADVAELCPSSPWPSAGI